MKQNCLSFIFFLCVAIACNHHNNKLLSFYYWKTSFHLGEYEKEALAYNAVKTLYVRYCDVDLAPGDTAPKPVSPVNLDTSVKYYNIVPVVFIKNRTFERIDSSGIRLLAENIFKLVSQLNHSQNIDTPAIQFDCDWTERTKDNYFLFIKQYRAVSKQDISCTIRLHQVKYPGRTGIPPVDHGVLMYYNMGSINAGPQSSIYEKSIADKYNSFIKAYPLQLDVALPIFSWGLKIRDSRVVELLNKIYFSHFKNDSNFRLVRNNWFTVTHACFKAGYYFAEGDGVKLEQVTGDELLEIAEQVNRYSNNKIRNIIFYDLDSSNLARYEKDIFKKILDRFD